MITRRSLFAGAAATVAATTAATATSPSVVNAFVRHLRAGTSFWHEHKAGELGEHTVLHVAWQDRFRSCWMARKEWDRLVGSPDLFRLIREMQSEPGEQNACTVD